jgi:hypothetical protein
MDKSLGITRLAGQIQTPVSSVQSFASDGVGKRVRFIVDALFRSRIARTAERCKIYQRSEQIPDQNI